MQCESVDALFDEDVESDRDATSSLSPAWCVRNSRHWQVNLLIHNIHYVCCLNIVHCRHSA